MISFNQVPAVNRVPFTFVEFGTSRALGTNTIQEYKVLMLGQKSGGTAPDGIPVEVKPGDHISKLFGAGSLLEAMIKVYFANNTKTELLVLPLSQVPADPTTIFEHTKDTQYHVIINPFNEAEIIKVIDEELKSRFDPNRSIEGVSVSAVKGNIEEAFKFAADKVNPFSVYMAISDSPTSEAEWAAALGAVIARYGNDDSARPFHTLPLIGVLPPSPTGQFNRADQDKLLGHNLSTFSVGADGEVTIQRLVTTSKDPSYSSVNTLLTLSFLRFSIRTYFARKYPRVKLASDNARIPPGALMMTPHLMKAELIALFRSWEDLGLVEDSDQFKSDLICERNAQDPTRIDVYLAPHLVGQLCTIGAKVEFIL